MDILGTIKGLVKTPGGELGQAGSQMFGGATETKEATNMATDKALVKNNQIDSTGGVDISISDENQKENITNSYDKMRCMLAKLRGK